ncbi:RNA pseudouridine synthase [bacterium SCSIO 12643]|nr:RNA pseudouridine synthase [bacterium SCSIO 12643]
MNSSKAHTDPCFIPFKQAFKDEDLPSKFTFPFQYQPHPIAQMATKELQEYLETQTSWTHQFWEPSADQNKAVGKMFGVLIVKNTYGRLGYLTAFSGILGSQTLVGRFVPPIYDRKGESSLFLKIEKEISQINHQIEQLQKATDYLDLKQYLQTLQEESQKEIAQNKLAAKAAKKERDHKRDHFKNILDQEAYEELLNALRKESMDLDYQHKKASKSWKIQIEETLEKLKEKEDFILQLKSLRKQKSTELQDVLFHEYQVLDSRGNSRSVLDIFKDQLDKKPPAGTGDCAAPKLIQYAFQKGYQPIALAEFWWGKSPQLEDRKHGQFYPACRTKCEPVLNYMLADVDMDPNPIDAITTQNLDIQFLFEDDHIAVIHKPANLLSVPGKKIRDSVFTRMKKKFPDATGPLLAHRLDMSTSGIMVISKSLEVHRVLQKQFTDRTVQKRYVALLAGHPKYTSGIIDLPLRVDLDHRPHQIVCDRYGKPARTKWSVIEKTEQHTRVYFYPITGRTHQLRVHASHPSGLNCPIVGDDLYGIPDTRLHLHAESITFKHPVTQEQISFQSDPDF